MSHKKENIQCYLFWYLHIKANLDVNGEMDEEIIRKKANTPNIN